MESRQRATVSQFSLMIEFMERHGDLGRFPPGPQARLRVERLWQRLAASLNSIGAGVKKSPFKWKKAWADWKSKTKKKALLIRRFNNTGTGGGPGHRSALTALETRVVALIGKLAGKGYSQTEEQGSNIETSPPKLPINFELKSRQRATVSQFALMTDFMERHGDLAKPPLGLKDPLRVDRLWQRLAGSLNSIGAGVKKSTDKWKKVWADWKSKTKKKALMIRRYNSTTTGAGRANLSTLTVLEIRLLALMEKSAVKGQSQTEEKGSNIETPPPKLVRKFDNHVELESRQRATVSQFSLMIEFMERYGDLAKPQPGPQSRLKLNRLWQRLAAILNANGSGVKKSFVKWKRVWADWKSKTKRKALMIRRFNNIGGTGKRLALTALETRVLALIGKLEGKGYSQIEEQESDVDAPPAKLTENDIQVEMISSPPEVVPLSPSNSRQSPTPPPTSTIDASTSTTEYLPIDKTEPMSPPPSQTSPSDIPSHSKVSPCRRRRLPISFKRVAIEFAAIERRRLELEEKRERNEARRIEVEHERNVIFDRFANVAEAMCRQYLQNKDHPQ